MNAKVIIIIVVGVLVVVGGNIALTIFLLGDRGDEAVVAEGAEGAAEAVDADPPADPVYVRIDGFTVTFDQSSAARFLQIESYIVVADDEAESLIEKHMPPLRAALVMLFASQTSEGLSTASGKERLRLEALDAARATFEERVGRPLAEDFLFTKFVMQ